MRTTVPEGFKALTEPQKTMVDVSFGDRQITSTLVEYTPETIRFLRPEEVIRSLPNVQRRDELLKHFRGEQPTHSGQVCVGAKQKDCGRLEPDHIGVIFDERRFHAEVFVNPDYLADVDKETGSYLGTPDKPELGLVQNLNFNHAGSNPGSDRSSLFGRTRVGRGSAHAFSSWVRTGEQKLSVDELGLRKDFKKHQLNMGLYQPRNDQLTILQRQPLIGAGIKRSFKRERGRTATFATELEVVLNGRARVELIKDGRLYDARPYEAGRRSLDTARLPPGAYNLKIRITESSGRTRTLERFFVKSRSLAPTDENLWFANAGRLQRRNRDELFPEDGGTLLTSAGVQHRYRDGIGLGLAAAAIEDEALLETTLDWLTADGQAHASFFADSEGGAGWLLRGSASLAEARLIFDSQRVWTQSEPPTPDYALLPDRIERDRLELRLPARKGSYFVSWRRLQRNDTAEQRTSTLGYTRTLQLGGQQSLNLNAALTRTNGVHEARLAVNWRLTRSHWQHQAGLAGRDTDGSGAEPERSASASSTWQDGDTLDDDLQLSAGVETDDSKTRASLDGRYDWQYGRGNAGVSWIRPDEGRDRRLTSASYDTNLVANGDGAAVGGPELNDAGIVIDLRGAEGATFDVLVDGDKRFVARGGHRAAITLRGYEDYSVAIRDRGTEFVQFDNTSRQVTLYPGNVETLTWELQRVMVILGKLVGPDGDPIGNATLEGTHDVVVSDPDGFFQGRIRGTDAELFARFGDERRCRLETGPIEPGSGVAQLGQVLCRPLDQSGAGSSDEARDRPVDQSGNNATPR